MQQELKEGKSHEQKDWFGINGRGRFAGMCGAGGRG